MIESPRLELLIARHGRTLVIALIAIGVLSLATTGWVLATPSTTATQEIDRETVSTDVTTSATVVDGDRWEEGTELEDNPVYLLEDTPELTLEVITTAPNDETTVEHEIELVYRATLDGDVFWEEAETIERTSASVDGDEATTTATIDVRAVAEEYRSHRDDFDVGSVGVLVVVGTAYDTGTYEDAIRGESTLELTEQTYRFADADSLSASREHSDTATVEVSESPNATLVGTFGSVAVLSFGLGAFVVSRSDVDEEAARLAVHRQRYADWISNGSLPMWMGDHHVSLDTLEDVVDVAIDTNERVVHDEQRGLFAVVDGGLVYYYSDRGLWEETAWPDMRLADRESGGTTPETGDGDALPELEERSEEFEGGSEEPGDEAASRKTETFEWTDDLDVDDDDVWSEL